jgi:hypothetical protein
MPYPKFNRDRLTVGKLAERKSKISIAACHILPGRKPSLSEDGQRLIDMTAGRIRLARQKKRSVMLAFGAHTIKNGLSPVLIALMDEGWITHFSTNGAGIIHDWEFAFQGKSSEDVRENVHLGQFGIWQETGFFLNLALILGAYEGLGYGESIGKMISQEGLNIPGLAFLQDEVVKQISINPELSAAAADLSGVIGKFNIGPGFMKIPHPFRKYSAQARAYELKIPFTGHPMIGHDIIYNHPVNNGAAIGRTALNDFLSFTDSVSRLDSGVYISLGSAVMSPMIFEKSLSMCRNVLIREGKHTDDHFIVVADLAASGRDWKKDGEPPADSPEYYMRYCKTFSRMGGEMHYMTADNRDFLPALYQALAEK